MWEQQWSGLGLDLIVSVFDLCLDINVLVVSWSQMKWSWLQHCLNKPTVDVTVALNCRNSNLMTRNSEEIFDRMFFLRCESHVFQIQGERRHHWAVDQRCHHKKNLLKFPTETPLHRAGRWLSKGYFTVICIIHQMQHQLKENISGRWLSIMCFQNFRIHYCRGYWTGGGPSV